MKTIRGLKDAVEWFRHWAWTGLTHEEMYDERDKISRNENPLIEALSELEVARKVVEDVRDTCEYLDSNDGLNSIPAKSSGHKCMRIVLDEYDRVVKKGR